MLTLVGRFTNQREQKMSSVLPYLAKTWNLVGSSLGSDLGNGCFQFRLNSEEDLRAVLNNRPYQYGRWMVIVQRWEPIISPSFPSQIPFWISLRGIPLHYWHEKVVRNIGLELGELETYEVTKSTSRVRVMIDGLKPLIMEAAMDFDSGEESIISLDYEKLGNHCLYCYRLSHLQSQCPERPILLDSRQPEDRAVAPPPRQEGSTMSQRVPQEPRVSDASLDKPYNHRLDRHGRPFGSRVSSASLRPPGPRNKITPDINQPRRSQEKVKSPDVNQQDHSYTSPPDTRRMSNQYDERERGNRRETRCRSPNLQWRPKSPVLNQEATPPSASFQVPNHLERNLAVEDFPLLPQAQSREEVMEDLRVVTLQYMNVPDPVEREARKLRVLQSELNGVVEETANHILQASSSNVLTRTATQPVVTFNELISQDNDSEEALVNPTRKRGRPPKSKESRPSIRLSPKTFSGMGSKKRHLARLQASPGTSSRQSRTSRLSTRQNKTSVPTAAATTTPSIVLIPPMEREQTDFPLRTPDLP